MNADARTSILFLVALVAFICVHPRFNAPAAAATAPEFEKRWLSGVFYGEGASFADFNRDGKLDVVSGPYIYEGPEFTVKREIMPREPADPLHYAQNFFTYTGDFDTDGWTDVFVIGFPGADAHWYQNPGDRKDAGHWKKHLAVKGVDNESPALVNIVGDGAPELLCMNGGRAGYATPDASDPSKPWTFHAVTPNRDFHKFTHGLGAGDVNGDGKIDLLEKSGWWEQPASSGGEWKQHAVPFSAHGGAQMHIYDVDGDGDNDVITSLNAHGFGLAWYEQVKERGGAGGAVTFEQHLILSEDAKTKLGGAQFSQLHALELIDMDGDGLKDLLTGKRYWAHGPKGDPEPEAAPVLYWFKLTREAGGGGGGGTVKFEPRLIDDRSGVGVMVAAQDINGDKRTDVVVGNKRGTMLFLSK